MRTVRPLAAASLATAAALLTAACGGDTTEPAPTPPPANQAPAAVGSLGARTIAVGAEITVDVAANFSDPDGDALTYTASTSDAGVATASVSGAAVTVSGAGPGDATITVTARDPGGLSATQTMAVTVEAPNGPPTVVGSIDDRTVTVGDTLATDVAELFEDPDGDDLTYGATSSDTAVATAQVDGATLTVVAIGEGASTVTVTATDPADNAAALDFTVTVEPPNRAPEIADTIPAQTLVAGDTVRLDPGDYFSDPDGDALSYEAVSANTGVATALIDANGMIEIGAQAPGGTIVTVTASDPEGLSAAQEVDVTVAAPPPSIADTIPTHDVIVDSAVPLDVSPYFEGGDLTYAVAVSDETVATASVNGATVTTMGVGAVEDSIGTAYLTVTATNADGGSVAQDSIVVRVHGEEYDSLPGISVGEEGQLMAQLGTTSVVLNNCIQLRNFPVEGVGSVTAFWTEWQRAVGGGWVTVQDNNKAHIVGRNPDGGGSLCPIRIEQDRFPPGTYRLVGHVQIGDEPDFYKTPTFEKKPPEG